MKSIKPVPAERIEVRVWDLPTRLFHWSLPILFALSWWSAETRRDQLHFWSGYALLFALLFRLGWGLVGSSTARFTSFIRGPSAVVRYLRSRWQWPAVGHTPLGAISIIAMLALLAFQVATGLIQTDEDAVLSGPLAELVSFDVSDKANRLHDLNFAILQALVALHLAAILFYRFMGKRLVEPMINGRARVAPGTEPMRPAPRRRAGAVAAAALLVTAWIIAGAPPLGG